MHSTNSDKRFVQGSLFILVILLVVLLLIIRLFIGVLVFVVARISVCKVFPTTSEAAPQLKSMRPQKPGTSSIFPTFFCFHEM